MIGKIIVTSTSSDFDPTLESPRAQAYITRLQQTIEAFAARDAETTMRIGRAEAERDTWKNTAEAKTEKIAILFREIARLQAEVVAISRERGGRNE